MASAARSAVREAELQRAGAAAQLADDRARRIRMRELGRRIAEHRERLRRGGTARS